MIPSTKQHTMNKAINGKVAYCMLLVEDGKRGIGDSPGKDTPIEESYLLPWEE